eukprot:scaffold74070_cov67-Phaeocystis_antarctica.AAC.3
MKADTHVWTALNGPSNVLTSLILFPSLTFWPEHSRFDTSSAMRALQAVNREVEFHRSGQQEDMHILV